jgi:hypothetical protein
MQEPRPPKPGKFAGWAQVAEEYATRVLPRYVGEKREEVDAYLGDLVESLRLCDRMERRVPSMVMTVAGATLVSFNEIIPRLHNHGVEDTEPLEQIRHALSKWLEKEECRRGPTPPI